MSSGYPGLFVGSETTGYLNIGAVQKQRSGALAFPGLFVGSETTSYFNIGAVQKPDPITSTMAATEAGSDTTAMVATFTGSTPVTPPAGGGGPIFVLGNGRRRLLPDVSEEMEMAVLTFSCV